MNKLIINYRWDELIIVKNYKIKITLKANKIITLN